MELTEWAAQQGRQVDSAMADALLGLIRNQLGRQSLAELRPGEIEVLLLDVCSMVFDPQDAESVVDTLADLVLFHRDTGQLTGRQLDAVMKETDRAAEEYLGEQLRLLDDDDELELDDLPDGTLRQLLGLPDHLPPMRLPPEDVLAGEVRRNPVLRQARELATWVGEGKDIDEDALLGREDAIAAAAALGLAAPEDARSMADLPELVRLWHLAAAAGFTDLDEERASTGDGLDEWPDGDDETVLALWRQVLAFVLTESLPGDAALAGEDHLDFHGCGAGFMGLFLARHDGIALADLSLLVKDTATDAPVDEDEGEDLEDRDLAGVDAETEAAWHAWVATHGDPATVLFGRLADLGAVEVTDDVVRLTPLGADAVRDELVSEGVEVPLLPPPDEMSAADLVEYGTACTEEELSDEADAWLALRSPEKAAEELLAAGIDDPGRRIVATSLAGSIGAAAEGPWRKALEQPALRPYAKLTLTQLTGEQPELMPTPDDAAWLLTDMLADSVWRFDEAELPDFVSEAVPNGETQVFERMWRLPHPNAHEALTVIGTHHPDKKTAKAARKAAFKIPGAGGPT